MRKYIVYFRQLHPGFQIPEFESILRILDIKANRDIRYDLSGYRYDDPCLQIELRIENDAHRIAQRSLLVRGIYRLYASGNSHTEARQMLAQTLDSLPPLATHTTWKFSGESWNRKSNTPNIMTFYGDPFAFHRQKFGSELVDVGLVRVRDYFLGGEIDLVNPDVTFTIIEDFEEEHPDPPGAKKVHKKKTVNPDPKWVYFGVLVAQGNRDLIKKYDLKKRAYLGTTSMDAALSLIMANQALATPGKLIIDPFVGTGSFLFTCAEFGAYTVGCDLDGRQLRGLTKHKNTVGESMGYRKGQSDHGLPELGIMANVDQYGLGGKVLDLLVSDHSRHPFRKGEWFDAIVTDPPYGVRAGAKKLRSGKGAASTVTSAISPRIPTTELYDMEEVVIDLLNYAAANLTVGGRLVFWLPTVTEEFSVGDIPTHPALKLVAMSSQQFSRWERRLITFEKVLPQASSDGVLRGSSTPSHAQFRVKYFDGFRKSAESQESGR